MCRAKDEGNRRCAACKGEARNQKDRARYARMSPEQKKEYLKKKAEAARRRRAAAKSRKRQRPAP